MKFTRTILAVLFVVAGFSGCGGCERAESPPAAGVTGQKPAAAPEGAAAPQPQHDEKIEAGAVVPTVAPQEKPAEAAQPGGAPPAAPQADALPELGEEDDDCIVVVDADPDYGPPPLTVKFTSEAECTHGTPKFEWDFGDGSPPSNDPNPSHTYTAAGDYTAIVRVIGAGGAEADDEIDITVEDEDADE